MESILNDLHEILVRTFQCRSYQLFFRRADGQCILERWHGTRGSPKPATNQILESVSRFLETEKEADTEGRWNSGGTTGTDRGIGEFLELFQAAHAFPLRSETCRIGLLLIGGRQDGTRFSKLELACLRFAAASLAAVRQQRVAEEDWEFIGYLSGGLAHDLQSRITPISTYLQLAGMDPERRESAGGLLPVAKQNLELVQMYIKASLGVPRLRRGEMRNVPLERPIQKAVEISRLEWQGKNLALTVRVPPDEVHCMDELLIVRLIANLLSNAINASPPQGRILIDAVSVPAPGGRIRRVRIGVADEGAGIPDERLREFSAGYGRGDPEGGREGNGLGLAICRKIAEMHGGSLSISRRPEGGTVARVDLGLAKT